MKAKEFRISIGGVKKTVVAILPESNSKQKSNLPTHHMFVIDRSGSMSGTLSKLIKQLHAAVDLLGKEDLVTVAWFSGAGSNGIVVQASPVTETVHKLIDSINSTMGLTCFSEILEKLNTTNKAIKAVCPQSAIHIFTDGQPVVSWSVEQEKQRAIVQLTELVTDGVIAVNTVGYGNYYNRDLLMAMSDVSEHGLFTHSTNIEQYYQSLLNSIELCNGLTSTGIEVFCQGSDILYAGKVNSIHSEHMKLSRLDKEKNGIFVVRDNTTPIIVDDVDVYVEKSTQKEEQDLILDFFYAYAEQEYYRGRRQVALDIIVNNAKDKAIADAMINAFTNDEIADVQTMLRDASAGVGRFTDGTCSVGYLPKKDAFCLMDMFNAMIQSSGDNFYVPYSKNTGVSYERVTRKVEDNFDSFVASDEEVKQSVEGLVWNKDRLNLSLRFTINGIVKLNPKAAKAVGLLDTQNVFSYRTHTFVKDGQLNIKKAEFIVSPDVLAYLQSKAKKLITVVSVEGEDLGGSSRIVINLSKLPVINRTYIDNSDSLDDLLNIALRITKNEAAQKAVGILIDEIYENGKASLSKKQGIFAAYTLEQIRVLEEHGIRKDGTYGGVDKEVASSADSDSYETKSIIFQIKGAASLPSAKDFKAMMEGTKKVNAPGEFMISAWKATTALFTDTELSSPTKAVLERAVTIEKELRKRLSADRQYLATIKMAKVLTGDFFHGLTQDDKGNYTHELNGNVLVVKTENRINYV